MKHQSLFSLVFAAKQRLDASPELIDAGHKALMAGPQTVAYGQSIGDVVDGSPDRLAMAAGT